MNSKDEFEADALNYAYKDFGPRFKDYLWPTPDYGNRLEEIRNLLIWAGASAEHAGRLEQYSLEKAAGEPQSNDP